VRKSVAADDSLVGLHRDTCNLLEHLAGWIELFGSNAGFVRILVGAHTARHHNLFERRVSCALADSVDRAFHLPCASGDCSEGVRDGETQVVMAMRRDDGLLNAAHSLPDTLN